MGAKVYGTHHKKGFYPNPNPNSNPGPNPNSNYLVSNLIGDTHCINVNITYCNKSYKFLYAN